MFPSLIRAMARNWCLPSKDCPPKELSNLPKNMIHEFKKWYDQLNEWEAKWRSRSYVNTAETAHIAWSHILMSRMELEFATCRLMWAMGLCTDEVWVQKKHGTKPKRWYKWERFKPNTPAYIAITDKLQQLLDWEGLEHYTTEAMTQYRRWVLGIESDFRSGRSGTQRKPSRLQHPQNGIGRRQVSILHIM